MRPAQKLAIDNGGRRGGSWALAVRRIEDEIKAGVYSEGKRLPTEVALSRLLGINRHSLRRAIEVLITKGTVRRVSHVGIFVAPKRVVFEITAGPTASDGLKRIGMSRGHRLLSQRLCKPPARIASMLGVAQRTDVLEVVHLSTANDQPFGHITTWLPADRFERAGAMLAASGNMREVLEQLGLSGVRRKAVHILTREAAPNEQDILGLPAKSNVLVIDSLGVDRLGEPTHVSQCVVDAGRVELVVPL